MKIHNKEKLINLIKSDSSLEGVALSQASKSLAKDKEVVKIAVLNQPASLKYADQSLKADKQFILELIRDFDGASFTKNVCSILEFSDPILQNDKEVVEEAVKKDNYSINYASSEVLNDDKFMYRLVIENKGLLNYDACKKLARDQEFMLKVLEEDPFLIQNASESIKSNKFIMDNVVSKNGNLLFYASSQLKNDKDLALRAIKEDEKAFAFVGINLKSDENFLIDAIVANPNVFDNMKKDKLTNKFIKDSNFINNVKEALGRKFNEDGKEETFNDEKDNENE